MASVSISEAARLAGVSRKTIQRHIASGKLSATLSHGSDTNRQVEISELMRVYGQLDAPVPESSAPQVPKVSSSNDALVQVIEAQKETIDLLKNQVSELTTEKRELRAQMAGLLEYRKPATPIDPVQVRKSSIAGRLGTTGFLAVILALVVLLTIPLWLRQI